MGAASTFSYYLLSIFPLVLVLAQLNSGWSMTNTSPTSRGRRSSNDPNNNARVVVKKWLVVDFDGTCSENDTTGVLPKLAAILSDDECIENRLATWSRLSDEYLEKYGAAKERICHKTQSLDEALDSLDEVSTAVTQKVSSSQVLAGLNAAKPGTIQEILERDLQGSVQLRQDCAAVLARSMAMKWSLGVLSINWCPALIQAALLLPLSQELDRLRNGEEDDNSISSESVPVWSNQIDCDGKVELDVPGATAKKTRIAGLRQGGGTFVIYVGDSSTDLSALLEADVGILIYSSTFVAESTIAVAERWGVRVLPLADRKSSEGSTSGQSILWTASSWEEIEQLILNVSAVLGG